MFGPLKDNEYNPMVSHKSMEYITQATKCLPANLPQREFKFPLFPLTELHNVEVNGYSLKSSLISVITDGVKHAGPVYPSLQLYTKGLKSTYIRI